MPLAPVQVRESSLPVIPAKAGIQKDADAEGGAGDSAGNPRSPAPSGADTLILTLSHIKGLGMFLLSESGFAGLKDSQDSSGARVFVWQELVDTRIDGISSCGEKRKPGETKS